MEQAAIPARSTQAAKDRLDRAVTYYAHQRGLPVADVCNELVRALIRTYAMKPGRKARKMTPITLGGAIDA